MAHCPHQDIRDCPLYAAAHEAALAKLSCCAGFGPDWCMVDKGLNYAEAVAKLRAVDPRFVAIGEFQTEARRAAEQRERNFRCNGIH